eukprot:CAMPEP_0113686804 /NCGR_PEP_ID=MMETSP0038_2-20120614/15514_1 /TAXON_ID=2898 /ORGANISM="Cryptomonas paramecium" /LENGTH=140 /DNA_ID=CAMNT_0000607209 /DNA_START=419 /DNA_END=841 /DNA_ORIENTATION=+ /assembly_acc=CAM_ASM_000170
MVSDNTPQHIRLIWYEIIYVSTHPSPSQVRGILASRGYWADASCPITGYCMFGPPTSTTYNELESLTHMLGFQYIPIGCCGIVVHPTWGRAAYPVSFLTLAPLEELQAAIREASAAAAERVPDVRVITEARELVDGDSCI